MGSMYFHQRLTASPTDISDWPSISGLRREPTLEDGHRAQMNLIILVEGQNVLEGLSSNLTVPVVDLLAAPEHGNELAATSRFPRAPSVAPNGGAKCKVSIAILASVKAQVDTPSDFAGIEEIIHEGLVAIVPSQTGLATGGSR